MEMKRIMISNTYIPGCSTEFKLSCYEKEDSKAREEADNEEFKELDNIVESGLADGCKKNHQYQQLIIKSEIGSRDSKELLKQYFENSGAPSKARNHSYWLFKYHKCIKDISQNKKDFVMQCFKNKWSLK